MNSLTPYTPNSPEAGFEMAKALVKSGLLSNDIRTPEQAFCLMVAGSELGLAPMESLRNLEMVKGKITMKAELMLRLVAQNGVRFRWEHTDSESATLVLKREGWDSFTSTFTMADAKRAGLAGRGNWNTYPANMLRARAISNGIRAFCPDLLTGVYHTGELSDPGPVQAAPEEVQPARWEPEDQRRFFAVLAELPDPKVDYDQLKRWCAAHSRPKPSEMTEDTRVKLLAWLANEDGRTTYEEWCGKEEDSQPIDIEPDEESP